MNLPLPSSIKQYHYFSTPIFTSKQPQFLEDMRLLAYDKLRNSPEPHELHPVRMSDGMLSDVRVAAFAQFIANMAWDILAGQGFAMQGLSTTFTEMWCQEHWQTSSMEQHIHGGGNHVVGMYFLDVPEEAPKAVFHDPRHARLMLDLPQSDASQATLASTAVNFTPEAGMLILTPAWLAHSFGRNPSSEPFRFVHFNLAVQPSAPAACFMPDAEVV